MPSFQFAQSKNMVQTQPVQYNVQPNLSASRAFEKLQQGLMAGAQLKSTLDENAYRDELAVLTKEVEEFAEFAGLLDEASRGKNYKA